MEQSVVHKPNRLPACLAVILALALPFLHPANFEQTEPEQVSLSDRTRLVARDYQTLRFELKQTERSLSRMESALAE